MSKVFICYRRTDTADVAGRIFDRLVAQYGAQQILKDVDSIPLGVDFRDHLDRLIAECDVFLVIIGKRWLGAWGEPARLEDPKDFVRIEIESALARQIPVIPLFVSGASMPSEDSLPESIRPFVYRNGVPVRPDPDFHRDMDRVISGRMERNRQPASPTPEPEAPSPPEPTPPDPRLTELHALLQRFAGDPIQRVKAVERFIEEHGDPRFREDAWFLPEDPLLGFIEIPAGPFTMGSDEKRDTQASKAETPQHEVALEVYNIARYSVTVAQFRAYLEASGDTPGNPDSLRGTPSHPVVKVSWHEAVSYCRWLTETLRMWEQTPPELTRVLGGPAERPRQVMLPSEAEWEKAARGTDGRIHPWGSEADSNRANYGDTGIGGASVVGCFSTGASPLGVEEMCGNVWEWTRSLWGNDVDAPTFRYPYESHQTRENLAAPDDVRRVLRGGAFDDGERGVRAADRLGLDPHDRFDDVGFRVALAPFSP